MDKLLAFAVLLAAYWTLSLPLYVDIACLALLVVLWRELPARQCVLTATSAVAAIVGLVPCVHALRMSALASPFYRDHEMFAIPGGHSYRPNVIATIEQPQGDLCAIDPSTPWELREPRTVEFRTDSLGYRNATDYHQQLHVIAGDSFAVANGTTQSQTLQEQLLRHSGLDTYSIAFPGGPRDYFDSARDFRAQAKRRVLFSFLFYEGNDFKRSTSSAGASDHEQWSLGRFAELGRKGKLLLPSKAANLLDRYDALRMRLLRPLASSLGYPGVLFGASRRVERSILARSDSLVSTFAIAGRPVGFLAAHNRASLDPDPGLETDLDDTVLKSTACVFFVPTKLRVYRAYLPEPLQSQVQEPAPAFELLRQRFEPRGISVVDLTPMLQQAASRALAGEHPEYVYWRDDTHWNGKGIAAVTPAVANCLRSQGLQPEPQGVGP